jgi:hypothetical protein
MAEANNKRQEDARRRITKAVRSIEAEGILLTASEASRGPELAGERLPSIPISLLALMALITGGVSAPLSTVGSCNVPVAVLTSIFTAPEFGFEETEKTKNPLLPLEDSGQAASVASAVVPPSPPQAAAKFRFGALSAEQPCELSPIYITPPLLLPGEKPTSEPLASSPSPTGCFASLDAGAQIRWYSVRGSGAAGGLKPEPNFDLAEVSSPVLGAAGISLRFRTIAPVVLKLVQAVLPLLFIQSLLNSLTVPPGVTVLRSHESGGTFVLVLATTQSEEIGARGGVPP